MTSKNILPRTKIADFIDNLYDGDLHAKRVLSLANATLGVLVSALAWQCMRSGKD